MSIEQLSSSSENAREVAYRTYDPVDSILWGTPRYDVDRIKVYFGEVGFSSGYVVPGIPAVTSEGFTNYEKSRFLDAFARIEAVANITFEVTNYSVFADMELTLDLNELEYGLLGYFTLPTGSYFDTAVGVFNGSAWDRSAGGNLEPGGEGFATITHEVLHGLGFAHAHDSGGTSTVMDGVTDAFYSYGTHDLNQGVYTTQSYNGGLNTGAFGTGPSFFGGYGIEAGPMALDIGALQRLYGANMSTATGNDVYTLVGRNASGTAWESIWDAGGVDEIRHTGSLAATIDLRAATLRGEYGGGGFLSQVEGIAGGFTIANGVTIETATGGSGNDMLIGNEANNRLDGGDGNDTLQGGGGNDRLLAGTGSDQMDGGAGVDTVDYQASFGSLRVDLMFASINTNIAAGDTYTDIENLSGSRGADNLRGTLGDNLIQGQSNVDYIFGRRGADTLEGGVGNDVLFGGVDADVLRGGANRDRAQYSESLEALVLDLLRPSRNTGEAVGDVYDSIEDLAGGKFDDHIAGNNDANQLFGREGNDSLYGREGDDYLNGGANSDRLDGGGGNDTLRGGTHADTFVFTGGHDVVEDMNLAQDDLLALQDSVLPQLIGMNGTAILAQYGALENGDVVLRFTPDMSVVLENITTMDGLGANIFVY